VSTFASALRSATVTVLLGLCLAGSGQAQHAPLSDRLDGFDTQIEQVMNDWSVPGLAIGIVTDSSVVWSKGFGDRNVEAGTPVTDETLFAIGSTTKAFTAAGLGILHDEGTLDWSTPVREYLPRFQLQDRFASQEMTPIDLLTHRSGLPRHDLMWYATDVSREELFRRLRHLEPSEPFRSTFQYSNQMYMTAGYLAGQISGSTWETFTRRRLLEPLGMSRSTFSVDSMRQTDNYARPYSGGRNTVEATDYYSLGAIGPAGGINSSVSEMTNWLQLFLNDGRRGDTQVIDSATVSQLTRPRIVAQEGLPFLKRDRSPILYALGWTVETRYESRVLQHSGGIDGFTAMVGIIPDRELGWVVLTNKGRNLATNVLARELIDRVLDREGPDWNQRIADVYEQQFAPSDTAKTDGAASSRDTSAAPPPHPLGDYTGRYTNPGYGAFEITRDDDRLVGRYGSLRDTLRHRHYDVFSTRFEIIGREQTVKVRFETAMDGTVDEVVIPLEPALDPIVFTRAPQKRLTDASYLRQFAGDYALRGRTLTVHLQNDDTLVLTIPGQPTYTLVPTTTNEFNVEGLSGYSVAFSVDEGAVVEMEVRQPDGTYTAPRTQ